ncbi:hypothetical protein LTS07_008020 [Exophiala sideris]|uniref:Uncharacterized protein n=1 Tax=Exophiala sideris TaxID=1016849 RepID=A0ABR0JGW3_9EURO|nr:hypothetical protein LTS07_008020 [Exophiala sideris]KAK5029284.1 hypothetical protein LTR13_008821 [Exophiala sideris]KAK5063228.1 hypothetical protein LTR69_003934 [Exophiala sideris]KAK5178944.1 hypothetical protein LTR44_008433 [Eurotiomycetes sp. CCFEE 6388]
MTSTELLYIPYRNPNPGQPSAESRQKHAAREYHRKRRLSKVQVSSRRAANPSNINAKRSNASAEKALQHSTIAQDTLNTPTASPTAVALPHHPDILGKWRLDPFNALHSEHLPDFVQEMLDHAIRYQWALYAPSRKDAVHTQNAIMTSAMKSPVAFYSIIFAGACHYAFLQRNLNISKESVVLRMSYKTQALTSLRNELEQCQGVVTEEVLLSIILLAIHDKGDTLVAPKKLMDSPLRQVKDNEFYTSMRWQPKHLDMLFAMLKQLGGLQSLRMHGLAEAIESTALNESLLALEPPRVSLLHPASYYLKPCQQKWDAEGRERHKTVSARKFALLDGAEGKELLSQTIADTRKLLVTYECFRRNRVNGPDLLQTIGARRSIQWNLQRQLPSNDCRYRVCRYAMLIFLVETIHPKPRYLDIHRRLAEKLMLALDEASMLGYTNKCPEDYAWASILGGAAASETSLDEWYRAQMSSSCGFVFDEDWESVKSMLSSFLVPGAEHEERCKRFWHEAREYYLERQGTKYWDPPTDTSEVWSSPDS